MKYIFPLIIFISTLISCQKNTIDEKFNCNTPKHFTNTKEYKDVLNKFKIEIPKYWKTELYFDEFQSEVYSADTTKQLSETYIIDIAWHQGELKFNSEFEQKVIQNITENEQLIVVDSGYGKFMKKDSYYIISVGENTEISYHFLEIYLKSKDDEFYTFTSKIYGNEFVNERICASISLFKSISFLK